MKNKRLLGIDLCRGLAVYAVIMVHSGDRTWGVPVEASASFFRLSFYFAVPFFLAASFYFVARKPKAGFSTGFWKSRLERILVPYIVWSIIYFGLRCALFLKSNQYDRLEKFMGDPLATLFWGTASFHLYFLPLLLVGTSLVFLSNYLLSKRLGVAVLLMLSALSIVVYEISFPVGDLAQKDTSMNPLLRLGIVYGVFILKCLPYFLIAILSFRLFPRLSESRFLKRPRTTLLLALVFLFVTISGRLFMPVTLRDVIVAFSLLLLGVSITQYIKENGRLVKSVGACAFGIYLIHPILMNFVKPIFSKLGFLDQITIASLLIVSISTFLLSWITVSLLSRNKQVGKYLFGV